MQIFEKEISDGLENTIKATASISYASHVEPSTANNHNIKHIKSLASLNDSDLYYVQSILVSSTWNKNDDIFDASEIWLARHTPEDKPTNLEHDEHLIIGHITANWPITDDGILIDENTPMENLPEKFHILTGSVIYKAFSSLALKDRADKLIAEIESGNKYVSMECYFKGFDYGLQNKETGNYKILARNEETAFLTKHLRSYGGMGEHDGYRIGRVLRGITFSGKGFVDKPANPDSIIFTTEIFANLSNIGVFDNQPTLNVENTTMNSTQTETVASTEQTIVATPDVGIQTTDVVTETTTTTETVATDTALVDSLQTRIVELESQVASQLEIIEAAKKMKEEEEKNEVEDKKESKKEEDKEEETEAAKKIKEEMKKVKSELDAALEAIAGYKMKEQEMAKKEKKMKRMASLIEAGIDSEVATSTVDKFESLDDDAFEAMTSLFAGKMPPWLDKEKDKKGTEKKKASEEIVADESVLDSAVPEETVDLGVGSETDTTEVSSTRAALVDFVCNRLGKTLNKGE
jgi:hypothetical protein